MVTCHFITSYVYAHFDVPRYDFHIGIASCRESYFSKSTLDLKQKFCKLWPQCQLSGAELLLGP